MNFILKPSEVGISGHLHNAIDSKEALNRIIAAEMFDGIIREVVEETGIPAAFLVTSSHFCMFSICGILCICVCASCL